VRDKKRALTCVVVLVCGARWAVSRTLSAYDLTVVLDFKGPHTARSVTEMEQEAQRIVEDAGIHLDWHAASEASRLMFSDLVVVQFKGACIIDLGANLDDARLPIGPLAVTHEIDGRVQPFAEVACDTVAASVRSAVCCVDSATSDVLLGRALGRVLVHEIVHILTNSGDHGREGLEKPMLSGKELITQRVGLSRADLRRLRAVSLSGLSRRWDGR
jgi:hypothetical protein